MCAFGSCSRCSFASKAAKSASSSSLKKLPRADADDEGGREEVEERVERKEGELLIEEGKDELGWSKAEGEERGEEEATCEATDELLYGMQEDDGAEGTELGRERKEGAGTAPSLLKVGLKLVGCGGVAVLLPGTTVPTRSLTVCRCVGLAGVSHLAALSLSQPQSSTSWDSESLSPK